jgi:murein DD-endopeptidase MepM/ murein hydrolase activator NlpD
MGNAPPYIDGMRHVVLTLLAFFLAIPASALELALPVACTLGTDCWVQQYVDHEAGPRASDFTCGVASYEGHNGTDIRVSNTSVVVDVIAAAAGRVKAVRDGVADKLLKTESDRSAVNDIECGNGMVIDHGGGWETQYCHMRKASVAVKAGQDISVGQHLGLVGYSGAAAFPHLHLTVRKDGKVVDPFSADSTSNCKAADRSMWTAHAQKALTYKGSELLQLAWAPRIYGDSEVESGSLSDFNPNEWSSVVLFAEAINLHEDDVLTLTVSIPGQEPVVHAMAMKRNRAIQRLYAGKKIHGKWPRGVYVGRFDLKRGDVMVVSKAIDFVLLD